MTVKKILLCISLFFLIFAFTGVHGAEGDAQTLFGTDKITDNLQNGGDDLVGTTDNILGYIIGLFYFIAVIFGIYAGFIILTGAGEEEKLKKGKNILLYVVLGLIVIFLASQIITWVISILSDTSVVA